MKKLYLFLFIILIPFFSTRLFAQVCSTWATGTGIYDYALANSTVTDGNGNVYITGCFYSQTMTFGSIVLTNPSAGFDPNIFIAKYDVNGNVLWAKSAGGTGTDNSNAIAIDKNGNIYITGYFRSQTISFGSITLTNTFNGSSGVFVAKYDSSGNVKWAKNQGGDQGVGISTDENGNAYITGSFSDATINIGANSLTNNGSINVFTAKYDTNGNVTWAKSAGGTSSDYSNSAATDLNGNVCVTGYFSSPTITFGSTILTSNGSDNIFIGKYDTNGNVLWAKSAAGTIYGSATVADEDGNFYVTGSFDSDTIRFDTISIIKNGYAGDDNVFIIKYDSSGNALWAKNAWGSYDNGADAAGIAEDRNGNVYITGSVASYYNFFIAKYDANGNVIWARTPGNANYVVSTSIATDKSGNVYTTGYFETPGITFGSISLTGNNSGYSHVFVYKNHDLSASIISSSPTCIGVNDGKATVSVSGLPPITYLWTNGQTTSSATGLAKGMNYVIITDSVGCSINDSVNIPQYPPIQLNINPASLCNGTGIVALNNPNLADNYLWNTGQKNTYIQISSTGTYSVIATDTNGCTNTASITVSNIYSNCEGFLELTSDSVINYFDTLHVQVKIWGGTDIFSTYANLNFDSSLMQLAGSTVGNYLGSAIINTPADTTGGTVDFGMTKNSPAQNGSYGDGVIYNFMFTLTNLPTNVAFNPVMPNFITTHFSLSGISVYDTLGNHPSSFNDLSVVNSYTKINYYVPVWPGDLNNDHNVNVADILPIGYFYNGTGAIRPNGSLSWKAQPAILWGFDKTNTNSTAYETFADGNADGVINLADQASIGFNLDKSHLRLNGDYHFLDNYTPRIQSNAASTIYITIPHDTISFPYNITASVNGGSNADPLLNLYGLAFDILFDPTCVSTSGISLSFTNVFGAFGTDYTSIVDSSHLTNGKLSIGLTRINNTAPISLYGDQICSVNFPVSKTCSVNPCFKVVPNILACNEQDGTPIQLNGVGDSLTTCVTGIDELNELSNSIKLYPNPTNNQITLYTSSFRPNDAVIISVMNVLGEIMMEEKTKWINDISINIKDLPAGMYFVEMKSESGSGVGRFVKE